VYWAKMFYLTLESPEPFLGKVVTILMSSSLLLEGRGLGAVVLVTLGGILLLSSLQHGRVLPIVVSNLFIILGYLNYMP
jgi:hypothetical protein